MRSEVGEAELNYEYPRFPISTSAPRLSYLAPKHVKETLYVKTSLKETECRSRIFQEGTFKEWTGLLRDLQNSKMVSGLPISLLCVKLR